MTKLEQLIKELCPNGAEHKPLREIAYYPTNRIDAKELNAENYVGVDNLLPDKKGRINSNYVPNEGRFICFSTGDILIGNIRPYLKKIWLATHNGGASGDVLTISIKNKNEITPKYLYYVMSSNSFFAYDMKHSKGAKMPRGNKEAVLEYIIPVPPLEVQYEIVRILDCFTELTEKLTAELIARQKQYEYYRDKLLMELCSDGVEQKKIKDMYQRLRGTPITASKMKEIESSDGEIRIFAGGKTIIDAYEKDIPNANITRVPAVLVQSRGVIDFIYYDKPFTFKNEMWAYTATEQVSIKYLYYVLKNNITYFREAASGMGSLPQISLPVTEDFKISVPPLEVQREIVRILDYFTELTAKLAEELTARQKQYEYYRDKLLSMI